MKKRAMKKWIPKKTPYCYTYKNGKYTLCKYFKYIKTIYYNKDEKNCPHNDTCKHNTECWNTPSTSCRVQVCQYKYLRYTDYDEDSFLWDKCKECNIGVDFI